MPRSLFARLHARYAPRPLSVPSRREVLQAALAASAATLIPSPLLRAAARDRGSILIIGAGFAGLSAAFQLTQRGFQVTLLEARSRISGRVRSFRDFIPGRTVEGGGEFIGSNHPTWLAYARRFNLEFLDVSEDEGLNFPVVIDGTLLSNSQAAQVYEDAVTASYIINADAADIDADRPWTSPRAREFDLLPTSLRLASLPISINAKKAINAQISADNGARCDRQSYLGNLAMIKGGGLERFWTDSEVFRCKGGNAQLADALADAIGRDRIILGKPVASVTYDSRSVRVVTSDHSEFTADHVILTAPPSTWPRIRFEPMLPRELDVQTGSNVKYLALMKKRFWLESNTSQYALANADIQETWEGTDGQPGNEAVAFACFSGADSSDRTRNYPPDQRDARYAAQLQVPYPDWRANFLRSLYLNWPSDPWTQCGYAFPKPGEVTTSGPILHDGLNRLHFAGEYASYAFIGYMEGALASGVRVARQIAGEI